MKIPKSLQSPLIMGGTLLAGSAMFLVALSATEHAGQHHTVKFEQPAAVTVTTHPPVKPSTSPTFSMKVNSPSAMTSKRVKKLTVRPLEVTESSTVPAEPSSSPSPSETAPSPTATPSVDPGDGAPDDNIHGSIYVPPPPASASPTPVVTHQPPTFPTIHPNS